MAAGFVDYLRMCLGWRSAVVELFDYVVSPAVIFESRERWMICETVARSTTHDGRERLTVFDAERRQ